jgi:RNA polymerase sigma-70 factor (ECF subfamily)
MVSTTSGVPQNPDLSSAAELIQHIPRLRRYARALARDIGRADDLVQDTLERALAKLDLWHPGSDLRAWLFTLMHNLFMNQLRASGNQTLCELDEASDIAVSGGQIEALAVRDIHAALARLPPEQREVMLLVGLEQFAYADAARIIGIPLGTVMSRLSRARERMRQLLEGQQVAKLQVVK